MTRSEIREAIKKVFFEEIEPDSPTKKMSFYSKTASKKYKSLDGKQNFRSRHEALAYNVFDNEGVLDQIESEVYRFQKICNKVPDFVWENKKIIIEIAGINESFRSGYWKKLLTAKPCFEKQGYAAPERDTSTHIAEHGSTILVVVSGCTYVVDGDYSWTSDISGMYALGTGSAYALGALHVLGSSKKMTVAQAKRAALKAIAVASKYDPYTGAPFHCHFQEKI